jgi:PIN domain nuclease of toxin-antitoxin system
VVRLLLDTHYLIWLVTADTHIGPRQQALLQGEETNILVSVISLWELRMKWLSFRADGTRKGILSPSVAVEFVRSNGWPIIPLNEADCIEPLASQPGHGDPHDEMLLVHAQRLNAKLLTADRALIDHPLAYRFD